MINGFNLQLNVAVYSTLSILQRPDCLGILYIIMNLTQTGTSWSMSGTTETAQFRTVNVSAD